MFFRSGFRVRLAIVTSIVGGSGGGPFVKLEADPRTVTRVALRNCKSIAACDIHLEPLTILVGKRSPLSRHRISLE